MYAVEGSPRQVAVPGPAREPRELVEDPGEWRFDTEETLETRPADPASASPERHLGSTRLAPAPPWAPPALAAAAWGGAIAVGWLGLAAPWAALAGALVGGTLGYRAARWPAGGLLGASSWTIGGIGAAAVIAPSVSAASATWWDAGLAGVVVGAWAAGGPTEERGAIWVPPAWALAAIGALQVAWRWFG